MSIEKDDHVSYQMTVRDNNFESEKMISRFKEQKKTNRPFKKENKGSKVYFKTSFNSCKEKKQQSNFDYALMNKESKYINEKEEQIENESFDKEIDKLPFFKYEFRANHLKYEQPLNIFVPADEPFYIRFSGKWQANIDSELINPIGDKNEQSSNGRLLLRVVGCSYLKLTGDIIKLVSEVKGPLLAQISLDSKKSQPFGNIWASFYNCKEKEFFSYFPEMMKNIIILKSLDNKNDPLILFNLVNFLRTDPTKFIEKFLPKGEVTPKEKLLRSKLAAKPNHFYFYSQTLQRISLFATKKAAKGIDLIGLDKFVATLPATINEIRTYVFKGSYEINGPYALFMEALDDAAFVDFVFADDIKYVAICNTNIKLDSCFLSIAGAFEVEEKDDYFSD